MAPKTTKEPRRSCPISAEWAQREASDGLHNFPLNTPLRVRFEAAARTYTVQIVLATHWSAHLGAAPPQWAAVRVVFLTRPQAVSASAIQSCRTFLFNPSKPLRHVGAAAETPGSPVDVLPNITAFVQAEQEALANGTIIGRGGVKSPDPMALTADSLNFLARLADMAEAGEVQSQATFVKSYLGRAVPKMTDDELYLDRISLQEQLSAGTYLRHPTVWTRTLELFNLFRAGYKRAYIRHHRDYRREVLALLRQLQEAEPNARSVGLLDLISELGGPVGTAALGAYKRCGALLVPCPLPEDQLVSLDTDPVCPSCRVSLEAFPPTEQVHAALQAVVAALVEQQRRLTRLMVRQVLRQHHECRVDKYIKLLHLADVSVMAQILDEDVVNFIRLLLREGCIAHNGERVTRPVHEEKGFESERGLMDSRRVTH